jgi:hypothetical protein
MSGFQYERRFRSRGIEACGARYLFFNDKLHALPQIWYHASVSLRHIYGLSAKGFHSFIAFDDRRDGHQSICKATPFSLTMTFSADVEIAKGSCNLFDMHWKGVFDHRN